jgi:glycosyltransferase involved in cell wall biosynthesis
MKTALYTTFYPAAQPYLEVWSKSVVAQTDQDFELWIAVDDVSTANLSLPHSKIHWLQAETGDTPASLRQRAFEEIIQANDAVIFVDSDDVLLPNRVSAAKRALKTCDVYGCALNLIDTNGDDLGLTFSTPRTDWTNLLSSYNVFGLSNTAYRTETLANSLPFPSDTVMVDWLLVINALQHDAALFFDQTPHMLYRQYANNTAKVLPPYTPDEIRKATKLVLQHYSVFEQGSRGAGEKITGNLRERLIAVQHFSASTTDNDTLTGYTKVLNALKPVFLWWECVAHPELSDLWSKT